MRSIELLILSALTFLLAMWALSEATLILSRSFPV